MSKEEDKFKHSKRMLKDENAIKKQVKIAKEYSHVNSEFNPKLDQPHRFAKHHAMDCGNPECFMCGNPRKTHKDKLTTQEKRMFQDVDNVRDVHSNGLPPKEDDERKD
jgi:hypothetical protein